MLKSIICLIYVVIWFQLIIIDHSGRVPLRLGETRLQLKLESFAQYYNQHQVHQSLDGQTPTGVTDGVNSQRTDRRHYSWQSH
jgi:hypothetical protein